MYILILQVGRSASPGRTLIIIPVLIIFASNLINELWLNVITKYKTKLLISIAAAVIAAHLIYCDIALIVQRNTKPVQQQASEWIIKNIPYNTTIGIPREIFYWTPDVIYRSFHHPERMQDSYAVINLDYNLSALLKERPAYIVASYTELFNYPYKPQYRSKVNAFIDYIYSNKTYKLIKVFPRITGNRFFNLNRPERLLFLNDDIWSMSIYIYKLNE
jgi:hypothetical protein